MPYGVRAGLLLLLLHPTGLGGFLLLLQKSWHVPVALQPLLHDSPHALSEPSDGDGAMKLGKCGEIASLKTTAFLPLLNEVSKF